MEAVPKCQILEQLPKNLQFCRPQAEKLREPVTKQPVLEQAQWTSQLLWITLNKTVNDITALP
jgi:hypothetical protein